MTDKHLVVSQATHKGQKQDAKSKGMKLQALNEQRIANGKKWELMQREMMK